MPTLGTSGSPTGVDGDDDAVRVFMSYRRTDDANFTGRFHDKLIGVFGDANVFRDIDSIPAPPAPDPDLHETISRALDTLPREQREAFLLRHVEGMAMAYLPKEKILIQADLFDTHEPPPAQPTAAMTSLHRQIRALQLEVVTIAPVHGNAVPMSEFIKAMGESAN